MTGVFDKALKNTTAWAMLKSDQKSGLGHAYAVISSDDDIVDEFFTLASLLLYCKSGDACGECVECQKILHGNNPDIYHINETREKIKVDSVTAMLSTVYIKSMSGRKLYFIHRADLMNVQAQNKLLKTLEEPPEDVTIFLGIANEAAVLPTVKSRTRKLHIDAFDETQIYSTLQSLGYGEKEAAIASACAEGKLGKARYIAQNPEYSELFDFTVDVIARLNRSTDIAGVSTDILKLKKTPDFLNMLSVLMRDMLVLQESKDLLLSKHITGKIGELANGYSPLALSKSLTLINLARKELSLNVSEVSVIDNLLFSILEVRHKCPKS